MSTEVPRGGLPRGTLAAWIHSFKTLLSGNAAACSLQPSFS